MENKPKFFDGFPKWFKYYSAIFTVVLFANALVPSNFGIIMGIITFLMAVFFAIVGFILLIAKSYHNQ